jgi:hypothetical protein
MRRGLNFNRFRLSSGENTMVKSALKVAIAGLVASTIFGCAGWGYPSGSLYTGGQVPNAQVLNRLEVGGPGKTGDKKGESCLTGFLNAVATGDASLDSAKKAGGITEIHSVELHYTNILGLYVQACTEVHGK